MKYLRMPVEDSDLLLLRAQEVSQLRKMTSKRR
jgi:hypothetical protein